MELNKENLENTLAAPAAAPVTTPAAAPAPGQAPNPAPTPAPAENTQPQMPKEMEIGFHQGALNTLAAERMELYKILQNVEKIMGMHIQRLGELGVKLEKAKE